MSYKINDKRETIKKHPTKQPPTRNINQITHIAIHHSLTPSGSAEAFANYHVGTKGWSRMGYTYVINQDGSIDWCADYTVVTPHVGKHNRYALGICLVGDFRSQRPTKKQYEALLWLINHVQSKLPNKCQIWGHSQFSGYEWKACPVIEMDKVRKDVDEFNKSKCEKGGSRIMELKDWQWEIIADVLRDQHEDGILSSADWEVKARNKDLSIDEAILLTYATLGRNLDRLKDNK